MSKAASTRAKFEELRALKEAGKKRFDSYEVHQQENLYDEAITPQPASVLDTTATSAATLSETPRPASPLRDTTMLDLTMSDTDEIHTTDDENMSSEPDSDHDGPSPVEICDENDIYTDTDIFDEGSSDEESSLDSMSTCYEELDDDVPITRIVEHLVREDSPYSSDCEVSVVDSEISNWSKTDTNESMTMERNEPHEDTEDPASASSKAGSMPDNVPERPKTFSQLESQRYETLLSRKSDWNNPWNSYRFILENGRYRHRGHNLEESIWELKAAEEQMANLESFIDVLKGNIELLKQEKEEAELKVNSDFERAGISTELYAEYEAFCLSLNPEFGQRGGFMVLCNDSHKGEYIAYDPDFAMFKEAVKDEMPYDDRNFRAEASGTNIVEFWPLECPEPLTDETKTWGDQYPALYELAIQAVRNHKSEAAMEMLVRLPDMNATLGGGWLFEYVPEPMLADHPVISMRWRYRSAHKIDSPVSVEGKRLRLQLMLQPDAIQGQRSLEDANMLLDGS